ncbi:ABC transporter transmembrane domain-containing protein [Marinivivus vitaminiproducens]|uniref:ABC transporter transmembrane domain-containing protein n=1 Tax=Marinivivus vitaminiproducens TaxID=3035935 RepID=UPI00279EF592|nr:ABC transporter transmembrane domain-containing protein [Geminicoccaceae bacterium SCSIO 64248]
MERSIFGYILRHSLPQQVIILAMTVASLPFYYVSLELPKTIINDALGESGRGHAVFGYELDQVSFLFVLCGAFLALVLVNGVFKYVINVYKGVVGERMLRRLRYELYGRILRFPLPHFRRLGASESSTMITAEVEPLGGFIGDAFSLPAYQGGMLLTTLLFLFMQNPWMGLAAVALYPVQIIVIPKLQRQVNELGRVRVRQVRRLAERVGETMVGAREIRANDAAHFERARFSKELGVVFHVRFAIYKKKFFIKFLNNFMSQLTPFFFYSIGGYLVLQGDLTLGALVAAIAAHEKLDSPWKELLNYYQLMADSAIKYEQVVAQYDPPGTRDARLVDQDPPDGLCFEGELQLSGVSLIDEDDVRLDGISFHIPLDSRVAVLGPAGAGMEELGLVLAGLLEPTSGRVQVGGHDLHDLPESVLGRRIAYVGNPANLFSGTIRDNLLLGLKHRPVHEAAEGRLPAREIEEARRAGNSAWDPADDWLDLATIGVGGSGELLARLVEILHLVRFDGDVYMLGLRRPLRIEQHGDLADRLLEARRLTERRLADDPERARMIERFDVERYNENATLAENLLFGVPLTAEFTEAKLAGHPYLLEVLDEEDLLNPLYVTGYEVADTMVELFADLPPDHEYFRQFNFIAPEDLPDFKAMVGRASADDLSGLSRADRERLLSLAFKLIPARHRLDLLDATLKDKVVAARQRFRANLPARYADAIAFFDPDGYTTAASLQDNILFGKIAYGQAQAAEVVSALVTEVIDALNLRGRVIEVGLDVEVGIAGSRLTLPQRQKLALARALLKQPDILILYQATAPLDAAEQYPVTTAIADHCKGRLLIGFLHRSDYAAGFDRVLVMRNGRIVEEGAYDELDRDGSVLRQLIAAE